ncbi:MAG: methylamine utilization protein [Elusimicrobiota bacterium]|nr:methylamine utilization protein [Elusimicrobiota bacterium]
MRLALVLLSAFFAFPAGAASLTATVLDAKGKPVEDAVVFLAEVKGKHKAPSKPAVMDQVGKVFVPHVLAVVVGSKVDFPNKDEIHHHVYSFSKTKRFDLPLYKGKPQAPIVMDAPGVVKLGCNIHDWMQGYIFVAQNPYFALTGKDGKAALAGVPAGEFKVGVWSPRRKQPVEESYQAVTLAKKDAKSVTFKLKFGPKPDLKPPVGGYGKY